MPHKGSSRVRKDIIDSILQELVQYGLNAQVASAIRISYVFNPAKWQGISMIHWLPLVNLGKEFFLEIQEFDTEMYEHFEGVVRRALESMEPQMCLTPEDRVIRAGQIRLFLKDRANLFSPWGKELYYHLSVCPACQRVFNALVWLEGNPSLSLEAI